MKYALLLALLLFFGAACAFLQEKDAADPKTWYHGPVGIKSSDPRLPLPVPKPVRQRFQADEVAAASRNSFMVWANAFPAHGAVPSKDAWAFVQSLELYSLDAAGKETPIQIQTWKEGDSVWGGWFPYNDNQWYQLGMVGQNDFTVSRMSTDDGQTRLGALIDISKYASKPAAGHVWQCFWPRKCLPAGSQKLRVKAVFVTGGNALMNVGLDRYEAPDKKPQPQQEVLVSDTYSSEQGVVSVSMETVLLTPSK